MTASKENSEAGVVTGWIAEARDLNAERTFACEAGSLLRGRTVN